MYEQHFSTRETPQSEPIPGTNQTQNEAGGYTWTTGKWAQLDRFLILGSENNSYYVSARDLTIQNAENVLACIKEDGFRVIQRVLDVSESKRAPKNDPALFVLAMCSAADDVNVRVSAHAIMPRVARTGTHLFHFNRYAQAFRGWGRGLRRANASWYNGKSPSDLAYQLIKYQSRDGWSHKDILRLAHPHPIDADHNLLYRWVTQGGSAYKKIEDDDANMLIRGFMALRLEDMTEDYAARIIADYRLPWEAVPTQFLKSSKIWNVLLQNLPMTATIRNLGRMTANGTLTAMNDNTTMVADRITNPDHLHKAGVHPIAVLAAMYTYVAGHGIRGNLSWHPIPSIIDALDQAYYMAFNNVKPMNKRVLLAVDVSGSMMTPISNLPFIMAREAGIAMALVTLKTEQKCAVIGYDVDTYPINISRMQRLDDAINSFPRSGSGTNCALPMEYALKQKMPIDVFIQYTDSQTWYGRTRHPAQALEKYRRKMGIQAKSVVVAMTAERATIVDPNDPLSMEVVGFDAAAPNAISAFVNGI